MVLVYKMNLNCKIRNKSIQYLAPYKIIEFYENTQQSIQRKFLNEILNKESISYWTKNVMAVVWWIKKLKKSII